MKCRAALAVAWDHRTKTVGIATGMAAGVENGLAQYGHVLPDHWRGLLLGIAGVTMFLVGLWNSFII